MNKKTLCRIFGHKYSRKATITNEYVAWNYNYNATSAKSVKMLRVTETVRKCSRCGTIEIKSISSE